MKPYLEDCGYDPKLLFSSYHFGDHVAELAAFAQYPADARSACVVVADLPGDPAFEIAAYREMGAPIVFVPSKDSMQWWTQGIHKPEFRANIGKSELGSFFERHRDEFSPLAVYRAKTRGRFEKQFQLSFVDVGLVQLVEGEIGKALSRLVERVVSKMKEELDGGALNERSDEWLFQSVFWLLAAKILQDKKVPSFGELDLLNVQDVFSRVARHYGTRPFAWGADKPARVQALAGAARSIKQFSNVSNVTSESLAYLYENALVSQKTRKSFATHSTPGYLVDYIVWRLAPWIETIPCLERNVLEPACGHAAFLVAALRVLRDLLPISTPAGARRDYLRERLHGVDLDAFALEIARLSLTLADIPNPDGWDLRRKDMFNDSSFSEQLKGATILLANPPFGRFSKQEELAFRQTTPELCDEKATELLRRILLDLKPGAVFGVIVPQSILNAKSATSLRRSLVRDFELLEVLLLPDKVFTFSDVETAVLLCRRPPTKELASENTVYKQVREVDTERFKVSYTVTACREVPQSRFAAQPSFRILLPDLEEIWLWCRNLPNLGSVAKISKGLDYKSSTESISKEFFPGAVRGFAFMARTGRSEARLAKQEKQLPVMIHQLPPARWMSLDSDKIATARSGAVTGIPQVLVNYVRVSRGPWRLKALLDEKGHAVTSAFLTVRPTSKEHSILFLWALCNSPVANAYVYSHTMKRHILTGVLRRVPLPQTTTDQVERVEAAARAYLLEAGKPSSKPLAQPLDEDATRRLLLRLDAEVLRLYNFPPRLERQLLDLFRGQRRPGLPFNFDQYFPSDFKPYFPLHVYLSDAYARSTADRLAARHKNATSPALLEALRNAVDAFEE